MLDEGFDLGEVFDNVDLDIIIVTGTKEEGKMEIRLKGGNIHIYIIHVT